MITLRRLPHSSRPCAILLAILLGCFSSALAASLSSEAAVYVDAVRRHADLILAHGRDIYGPARTPLFPDGLDLQTLQPVVWPMGGKKYLLSNFASQQTLLRTLTGLSTLTGDHRYAQAARDAASFALSHLRAENGLGYWGGHCFYDLATDTVIGREIHGHELKCHYPDYALFWQVDPAATTDYIKAMWGVHVQHFSTLAFNRHAPYDRVSKTGDWDQPFTDPEPFFKSWGLGFVTTGSDLIFAAVNLYQLSGDEKPLLWARRMAGMFEKTRNLDTGLVGYQYNVLASDFMGGDRAQARSARNSAPVSPRAPLPLFRAFRSSTAMSAFATCSSARASAAIWDVSS